MGSIYFPFKVFIVIAIVIGKLSSSSAARSSTCELCRNDKERTIIEGFTFVEVPETLEEGSLLATYFVSGAAKLRISKKSPYIHVFLNTSHNLLEFTLSKSLAEHRQEEWKPSIEIYYDLVCLKSDKSRDVEDINSYTFMVISEDRNYYAPQFDQDAYEFTIDLPWPTWVPLNLNRPIIATDTDFNLKFANVTAACAWNDLDCKNNFCINSTLQSEVDGYNYAIWLHFNNNTEFNQAHDGSNRESIMVTIEIRDIDYSSNATITFKIQNVMSIGDNANSSPGFQFPVVWVAIGSSIAGVVIIGSFSFLFYKNQKNKSVIEKLSEAEIREFYDGITGLNQKPVSRSIDHNMPVLAQPYRRSFEIPREKFRIDETTVLGKGFFGVVVKGVVERNNESTNVAVKSVKKNVGVIYFKALLNEIKIMAFIGHHPNIVSLIGACTHNIRKREVYIAVEFCSNGNMNLYLQNHRETFIDIMENDSYYNLEYKNKLTITDNTQMTTLDLVKWALQITNALEYLRTKGVIHGDVATRNVLLDQEKVAKLSDFGLSRKLVNVSSYYYTKESQNSTPLPWKWMSIESLKDMKFSTASDVWSLGITLWEIFSLGEHPYSGLSWNEKFVDLLKQGLRLSRPKHATSEVYEIMKDCWMESPGDRPVPFDIKRSFEVMAHKIMRRHDDTNYEWVTENEHEYENIEDTSFTPKVKKMSISSIAMKYVDSASC